MSYRLNSLKGINIGDYIGDYCIGGIKGDTRSLDYGSDMWFRVRGPRDVCNLVDILP